MLHIVADEHSHILYFFQVQIVLQIAFQFLRFHSKRGFLLYIDTSYISHEWLLQMFVAGIFFIPSRRLLFPPGIQKQAGRRAFSSYYTKSAFFFNAI